MRETSNMYKMTAMSYINNPGREPLRGITIGQLLEEAAELRGRTEAIVDVTHGIRKTFEEVLHEADKLAAGFLALELKRGDRIAVLGPSSYEWYISFCAAARAGLILVTLNFVSQPPELKYCLNKVGVKALICAEKLRHYDFYDVVTTVIPEIKNAKPGWIQSKEVPSLTTLIIMSSTKYSGAFTLEEVVNLDTTDSVKRVQEMQKEIQFDEPCNIQFTSGTTGLPKATTLSHHGIVNNSYSIGKRLLFEPCKDRYCMTVQMFHSYGLAVVLLGALNAGITCVIPSPVFSAKSTLQAVEQERCTIVVGTPTMYIDMLNMLEEKPYDLSTLRMAIVGGATSSKEFLIRLKNKLGISIYNGFGMTETSVAVFVPWTGDPLEKIMTTVGFPLDHVEVKIVDSNNRIVQVGTPGELCVRGYLNMLGYWGDPEKTKETITDDRWLHTGDLAVLHEDGYASIVGRLKEMIIRGGENIFPKEIEDFLLTHPQIDDAQVVSVPDARLGEEVCAWLLLRKGEKLNEVQVREFCKGKLSYYKTPRYILFSKEFPKTASGKVHKITLQKEARKLLRLSKL